MPQSLTSRLLKPSFSRRIACTVSFISVNILGSPLIAAAVDHNNIDSNRPLRFSDADSIAYREQAIELGGAVVLPQGRSVGGQFDVEYLYGFAKNSQLSIDIDPSFGGQAGDDDTNFDIGEVGIGVLHNFNREYDNVPAFALRGDVFLPTGNDSRGVDGRLRAIASKTFGSYDRFHLNVDLTFNNAATNDERTWVPGVLIGYSRPIGYPKQFDKTLVAEAGVRANGDNNAAPVVQLGVGLRQQVSYSSVLDFGLQGDIATGNSGDRSQLKLILGYSQAF